MKNLSRTLIFTQRVHSANKGTLYFNKKEKIIRMGIMSPFNLFKKISIGVCKEIFLGGADNSFEFKLSF